MGETIYTNWHEDGTVKITVERRGPTTFHVKRETEDDVEQGIVMVYTGQNARERYLVVDQGHLDTAQIPAQAFTMMWNVIFHGKGL